MAKKINYEIVETQNYDCPFCNKVHELELRSEPAEALYKGKTVPYTKLYYHCSKKSKGENEFVSAALLNENQRRIMHVYGRISQGLPPTMHDE